MSRNLESEVNHMPLVNPGQNESKISHGVSSETYGFLIAAQVHNAFDNIDSTTRNSIAIYYGTGISLTELPNYIGAKGNKTTVRNRILKGLDRAWEQLPLQAQLQFPKEQVIKLKDIYISPRLVARRREIAVTLWQDINYRKKNIETHRRKTNNNPGVISKIQEISHGRKPPMEGKHHTPATIEKIKSSIQKSWNQRHGIRTDDPLAKRTALFYEWQRISLLLGHSPSSRKITRLKHEGKTRFSTTMYEQEFGEGSFTKAKSVLIETLKNKTINSKKQTPYPSLIKSNIGREERSMWDYAVKNNLLPKILTSGIITKQELDSIKDYFENMRRIEQGLTMETFNKFTIAVANVA